MNGNVAQLRSLVDEGANINGRNENGQTSLICAILTGQVDAVQLLLDAGADYRLRDAGRKGKPPLFHAIDAENRAAAELLLKHGADANQSDELGQAYFVNLVIGETAPQWIALLLSHGADAAVKDLSGRPLVVLVIQKRKKVEDREEVVRLLLRHGAKPDSSDSDGTPLIYLCVQQKRAGLVYELLAMGADPNARDVSGISLLATAIKHNDRHLAKALLERRADPNAPDIYGSHLIVNVLRDSKFPATDREALAEMLLEHGARGDKKDLWGVTALEHSLTPIVEDIAAAPSPGGTKLKIPELLLKQGADPNQRLTKVSGEPTLLVYALDRELWDFAAMALRHGANANLMDKKGRTPLVQAVQKGNVDAVALLIQHGANANQPRQTLPLDVAIAMGKPEIIELLKAHGAVSANNTHSLSVCTGTSPPSLAPTLVLPPPPY
jgi:ankyrin repeat protein